MNHTLRESLAKSVEKCIHVWPLCEETLCEEKKKMQNVKNDHAVHNPTLENEPVCLLVTLSSVIEPSSRYCTVHSDDSEQTHNGCMEIP